MIEKVSEVREVLSADGSVAFSKAIEGRLFLSMETGGKWGIGTTRAGGPIKPVIFDPPLDGDAIGPSVLKTPDGYLMGVALETGRPPKRVIAFAESETLDGTWHALGKTYSPMFPWEGRRIDLGSGSFMEGGTANFYYSSVYPTWSQMASRLVRHPMLPSSRNLRRLVRRRVGVLGLRLSDKELRTAPRPINIPSTEGTVTESVFCPGYLEAGGKKLLFPAGSNYSMGYPYKQAILCCEGASHGEWGEPSVVLDDDDLPVGGHASFDWADPVLNKDDSVTMYFSAFPRDVGKWSIFKCELKLG